LFTLFNLDQTLLLQDGTGADKFASVERAFDKHIRGCLLPIQEETKKDPFYRGPRDNNWDLGTPISPAMAKELYHHRAHFYKGEAKNDPKTECFRSRCTLVFTSLAEEGNGLDLAIFNLDYLKNHVQSGYLKGQFPVDRLLMKMPHMAKNWSPKLESRFWLVKAISEAQWEQERATEILFFPPST
jgi:hypothetical protein